MKNELERWIRLINERGHASVFAARTPEEKRIVEKQTAADWAQSMRAEYGLDISEPALCVPDPPDCTAEFGQLNITIEMTELVDQQALKRLDKARHGGQMQSTFSNFDAHQWDVSRFQKHVNWLAQKKNQRYSERLPTFDVLLIYTAEDWLRPNLVESWLPNLALHSTQCFRSIYLLMDYDPTFRNHSPVFLLHGSPDQWRGAST